VICYGFLAWSYFLKTQKQILRTTVVANTSIMVAFILLGGWSGVAMCAIAILADIIRYQAEDKRGLDFGRSLPFLLIVLVAVGVSGWVAYDGFLSLMSVFATAIFRFSTWQRRPLVYKLCGLPASGLWIIYNVFIGSMFGVILESALLGFVLVGILWDVKRGKLNGAG
jgi:hypothetical protein